MSGGVENTGGRQRHITGKTHAATSAGNTDPRFNSARLALQAPRGAQGSVAYGPSYSCLVIRAPAVSPVNSHGVVSVAVSAEL